MLILLENPVSLWAILTEPDKADSPTRLAVKQRGVSHNPSLPVRRSFWPLPLSGDHCSRLPASPITLRSM